MSAHLTKIFIMIILLSWLLSLFKRLVVEPDSPPPSAWRKGGGGREGGEGRVEEGKFTIFVHEVILVVCYDDACTHERIQPFMILINEFLVKGQLE